MPAATRVRLKVFVVDLESGEMRFGDGLRGARPPLGATLRADYDYGVGRAGNVGPAHAINTGPALPAGMKVDNRDRTWGGADAETVAEGEKQIARHLQHRDRLVTAADFEAITLRTPGVEIGRVDVHPGLQPRAAAERAGRRARRRDVDGACRAPIPLQPDAPRPDRFFLNTICDYLDPRRLVTTEVILRGPVYKPIWISVGHRGRRRHERGRSARSRSIARCVAFLSPLPPDGVQTLEDLTTVLRAPQRAERRRGWPLRKAVRRLPSSQAVVNRVDGVLLVNKLLVAEGTGAAAAVDSMTGLELPRVAGISVTRRRSRWISTRCAARRRRTRYDRGVELRARCRSCRRSADVDANGTRFHLLLGEARLGVPAPTLDDRASAAGAIDFRRAPVACGTGEGDGFGWDATRHELTLRPCLVRFVAAPNDTSAGSEWRGTSRSGARSLRQLLLDCRLVDGDPHHSGGDRARLRTSGLPGDGLTGAEATPDTVSFQRQ